MRAEQLAELKHYPQALALAGQATAAPDVAGRAHLLRARCFLGLGDGKRAEAAARESLAREPHSAYACVILGAAQLAQGRFRKALSSAQEAAGRDPLSVPAQYLIVLCRLRFGLGHRGRARAAAQRALRIDPHSPLALQAAGLASAHSGRRHRRAAEAYFRTGLAVDPHDQDLALALGDVLRKSGRHDEAADTYLAAAKLDPTDTRARFRLTRLGGPGIVGLGLAGKAAIAVNGGRLVVGAHRHSLALAAWGALALLTAAAGSTVVKMRRNRGLPAYVRAGLRSDYVNAALAWVRAAGVLLAAIALSVLVDPGSAHVLPAAWVLIAGGGIVLIWASVHFRYGPRLTWRDVGGWFRPRRLQRRRG